MRAVLQRVRSAAVRVDGELVGSIGVGVVALVGVHREDSPEQAVALGRKMGSLRILRGERSLVDQQPDGSGDDRPAALVISQFTLYGDARKGRRPTWAAAAPGAVASPLIDLVITTLRGDGVRVESGVFGADMQVELVNDGPTTLILDL